MKIKELKNFENIGKVEGRKIFRESCNEVSLYDIFLAQEEAKESFVLEEDRDAYVSNVIDKEAAKAERNQKELDRIYKALSGYSDKELDLCYKLATGYSQHFSVEKVLGLIPPEYLDLEIPEELLDMFFMENILQAVFEEKDIDDAIALYIRKVSETFEPLLKKKMLEEIKSLKQQNDFKNELDLYEKETRFNNRFKAAKKFDDFYIKCEPVAFKKILPYLKTNGLSFEYKEDHVEIMAVGDAEACISAIESILMQSKYNSAPGFAFKYIISTPAMVKTGGNSRGLDLFRRFSAEVQINW